VSLRGMTVPDYAGTGTLHVERTTGTGLNIEVTHAACAACYVHIFFVLFCLLLDESH